MSWGSSKVIGRADVPATCGAPSWTCGRAKDCGCRFSCSMAHPLRPVSALITTVLDPTYTDPARRCPTEAPKGGGVRPEGKIARQTDLRHREGPAAERNARSSWRRPRFHTLLTDNTDVDFWARIQRYFLWEYIREKLSFIFPKQNLDDVRLSTAAHNSARFPVISPPGAVRNVKHNVVDRIVDGGYIENYGALTAMELAVAINALRPELAPFVLIISNDPDENPISIRLTSRIRSSSPMCRSRFRRSPAHGPVAAGLPCSSSMPCSAVLTNPPAAPTRPTSACGRNMSSRMPATRRRKSLPVSMSWWLSTPIQIHLHQQTEGVKNQNENSSEIEKTWRALEGTSACMSARR